jgi:hypothetical protein
VELLDDQLRIEQQLNSRGTQLRGEVNGPKDAGVLGHVVRPNPEVVRDRRVGAGSRVERVRSIEGDERSAGGRGTGIAAGRPIRADHEALGVSGIADSLVEAERQRLVGHRVDQSLDGWSAGFDGAASGAGTASAAGLDGPGRTGSIVPAADADSLPRSLRQAHWIGS